MTLDEAMAYPLACSDHLALIGVARALRAELLRRDGMTCETCRYRSAELLLYEGQRVPCCLRLIGNGPEYGAMLVPCASLGHRCGAWTAKEGA